MLRRLAVAHVAALFLFGCSSSPSGGPDAFDAGSDSDISTPSGDGLTDTGGDLSADSGQDAAPPEVPLVPPKSGTRLKARFDDLGGLLIFREVFDTVTGESCYESKTTDGKKRCVPSAMTTSYYSDASCTTRIAAGSHGACPKTYARVDMSDPATCTGGNAYYKVGAQYTGPIYRKSTSGCVAATASASLDYYSLGAPVPDTDFQEVATQYVPITTSASAVVTTSADGLQVWRGPLYSPVHKVSATVREAGDDKMRVIPAAVAQVNVYKGGQTCNIALASGSIRCGKEPQGVAHFHPTTAGCDTPHTQVYTLGPKYTGQLYTPSNGCQPAVAPANVVVFEVGSKIPPQTFSEAVPRTLGNARVEVSTYAIANRSIPPPGKIADKQLGFECSINVASDGKRRCMPSNFAHEYFMDAACTIRVFGRYKMVTCGPPLAQHGLSREGPSCDPQWRVWELGAATTVGALYARNHETGQCETATKGSLSFFLPGPEIPAASLAEATLVE